MSEKTDVLQTLLDVQKLAGEIFDELEAGKVKVTRDRILKMNVLVGQLDAIRLGFIQHYVLSGRAGDDMLSEIQQSLRPPRGHS